jgi:hypothetical protein
MAVQHVAIRARVRMGVVDGNAFEWGLSRGSDSRPKGLRCLPSQADVINRQEEARLRWSLHIDERQCRQLQGIVYASHR